MSLTSLSNLAINNQIHSIISSNTNPSQAQDPFYILNLNTVISLFHQWSHHLPNVRPFYAVKCNPEPALLSVLAALGTSFDCASRAEIEKVLALGINPDRIIYANPCKAESHIKSSAEAGIDLTTFDSIHELEKMKRHHPKCRLLLRIKPPQDAGVRQSFGTKYGALPEEIKPILRVASLMDLAVVGVSFHIGTNATVMETYDAAIESARTVFDLANEISGQKMHILDIGGGFATGQMFEKTGRAIGSYIEARFGDWKDLTVMAEPGRYFAEGAFTLVACVIGKRVRGERRQYWISDGVFGSMMCAKLENAMVLLRPLKERPNGTEMYVSTVFGPTLDSFDVIGSEFRLPDLEVGEWLVLPNMGAYTKTLGSEFNGFSTSAIPVHVADSMDDELHNSFQYL